MDQHVIEVTEADVERIVCRDYPPQSQVAIQEIIRGIDVREKPRVILACLKNAGGDLQRLKSELANAGGWYREIISEAEYPNYTKKMFRIDSLSAEERARIIEADRAQYVEWFYRAG